MTFLIDESIDVLPIVYSFLNTKEIVSASLTCRIWAEYSALYADSTDCKFIPWIIKKKMKANKELTKEIMDMYLGKIRLWAAHIGYEGMGGPYIGYGIMSNTADVLEFALIRNDKKTARKAQRVYYSGCYHSRDIRCSKLKEIFGTDSLEKIINRRNGTRSCTAIFSLNDINKIIDPFMTIVLEYLSEDEVYKLRLISREFRSLLDRYPGTIVIPRHFSTSRVFKEDDTVKYFYDENYNKYYIKRHKERAGRVTIYNKTMEIINDCADNTGMTVKEIHGDHGKVTYDIVLSSKLNNKNIAIKVHKDFSISIRNENSSNIMRGLTICLGRSLSSYFVSPRNISYYEIINDKLITITSGGSLEVFILNTYYKK